MVLTDELRYKLLKLLDADPNMSQRQLSKELGISLGKINYCLNALLEVGFVKANNFKNSDHKLRYAYVVTPKGIEEKASVTKAFLNRKLKEADALQQEILQIKHDVESQRLNDNGASGS